MDYFPTLDKDCHPASMTQSQPIEAEARPAEDHRTRRARQRRKQMRAHLLDAVMAVCSSEGKGHAAVIDDVVRQAEVARGTFYKYFDSLEQAIEALAHEMADEMASEGIDQVYNQLTEPLMRTATGFQLYLLRALIEPQWGDFFTHVGLLNSESALSAKIVGDVEAGIASGDFAVPAVPIALDMLIGTKIEAIRRIISGNVDIDYVLAITAMMLRALGASATKSEHVAAQAFERICSEAPKYLSWWTPRDSWPAKNAARTGSPANDPTGKDPQ